MNEPIEFKPSPNHSPRDGALIRMLVLHATVGSYTSSLAWLTNPASRVSTHYLIRKDGHIAQLVKDSDAAWHAGRSAWLGLDSAEIRQCSLGVELENANDGRDPYPAAQLDAARVLCRDLVARYAITPEYVVRHLDIATPAGRKTDPAGFPWNAWRASLFAPALVQYRAHGVPIYQRQDLTGPIAAYLAPDETIAIRETYPNGAGHDVLERGFVRLSDLERL